ERPAEGQGGEGERVPSTRYSFPSSLPQEETYHDHAYDPVVSGRVVRDTAGPKYQFSRTPSWKSNDRSGCGSSGMTAPTASVVSLGSRASRPNVRFSSLKSAMLPIVRSPAVTVSG